MKNIVDATFLRKSNYSYVDYGDAELSSVLCFALAKNKADLILHQQRIELFAKNQQQGLLFSALIDLFTVLSDKGKDYKQRMLNTYGTQLLPTQVSILSSAIIDKLLATHVIPDLKHSLINLGNQGDILSTTHLRNLA